MALIRTFNFRTGNRNLWGLKVVHAKGSRKLGGRRSQPASAIPRFGYFIEQFQEETRVSTVVMILQGTTLANGKKQNVYETYLRIASANRRSLQVEWGHLYMKVWILSGDWRSLALRWQPTALTVSNSLVEV